MRRVLLCCPGAGQLPFLIATYAAARNLSEAPWSKGLGEALQLPWAPQGSGAFYSRPQESAQVAPGVPDLARES